MIKIGHLKDEDSLYAEPDMRAAMLGHAASDYYRACALADEHQWQDNGMPFFNFLLPTMHQTLELVAKAIAYKCDSNFNPKRYSHRTLAILKDYAATVPVFASISSDKDKTDLLSALETAYLGVRYGECYVMYDGDTWRQFVAISTDLFSDLSARTGLRFTMAHKLS